MYNVLYQLALDTYVCNYVDSLCHCEFSCVLNKFLPALDPEYTTYHLP